MLIWDIGGQTAIRRLWRHHFEQTDAIIFVVDSCDDERLADAREELGMLMADEELRDACLLVFANKIDMATKSLAKITEELGLYEMRRKWHIQESCAPTGAGLIEGLDWLSQELKKKK